MADGAQETPGGFQGATMTIRLMPDGSWQFACDTDNEVIARALVDRARYMLDMEITKRLALAAAQNAPRVVGANGRIPRLFGKN